MILAANFAFEPFEGTRWVKKRNVRRKVARFFFLRNDVIQIQFKDRKRRDWSEQRQSEDISQPTADGQDLERVSSEDCNRDFSRQSC